MKLWIATFEQANPDLNSQDLGLACIFMLDESIFADIAQYLPIKYKYKDIKRALLKVLTQILETTLTKIPSWQ